MRQETGETVNHLITGTVTNAPVHVLRVAASVSLTGSMRNDVQKQ